MERTLLLLLVITFQALYDLFDGTAQLLDSLITISQPITFQPITCQMLRQYGARGKTKQQLIASLAQSSQVLTQMTDKQRVIVETIVFCGFACIISAITMLGAVGVDPFESNAPQVQTIAKGNK